MRISNWRSVFRLTILVAGSTGLCAAAHALPVTADVANASNYSLVHFGAGPGGSTGPGDWLRFDAGQTIDLDFAGNMLSLLGAQTFTLASDNGATATLDITGLMLDLNDAADGFLSGTMDYVLDGSTSGTFAFSDSNYGNSVFNSSSTSSGVLSVYAWGGDVHNDLGIDFAISGVKVPEPGTLLLTLIGLAGLARARRS